MKIVDKIKRILAAITTVASVGGTMASQPPPKVIPEINEEEAAQVSNLPSSYSDEPAPFQAVMYQLSTEINKPSASTIDYSKLLLDESIFSQVNAMPVTASPSSAYKFPSASINLPHPEGQINYADLHSNNPATLSERIWELYDAYFDSEEIPESDFRTEREQFIVEIFSWFAEFTITSIAGGVLGNLAYDKLKDRIQRRQEKSTDGISKYYEKLGKDLGKLLEVLAKTEKEGKPIRVHDVSLATGISKEIIRDWLKGFGFIHYSNCNWEPTKRYTDMLQNSFGLVP